MVENKGTISGPDWSCRLPPHSLSAIIFEKEGRSIGPLPVPEDLKGEARKGYLQLTWQKPRGRSPHAYHIYRSRFDHGPYNHRIIILSGDKTRYRDRPADGPRRYTYAVRAVYQHGEESGFSNRVSLSFPGSGAK